LFWSPLETGHSQSIERHLLKQSHATVDLQDRRDHLLDDLGEGLVFGETPEVDGFSEQEVNHRVDAPGDVVLDDDLFPLEIGDLLGSPDPLHPGDAGRESRFLRLEIGAAAGV
jgi:hypothetical protein